MKPHFLPFAALLLLCIQAIKAEPSQALEETQGLLRDLTSKDYPAFIADGTGPFRRLTQQEFDEASSLVSPILKKGYSVSYLGEVRKQNTPATLWKIRPSNGGDDLLAVLSMRNGKVAGFWIHPNPQGHRITQ